MANTPKRPTGVMVAAVLMLIYGGYRILGGVVSLVMLLTSAAVPAVQGGAINQADVQRMLEKDVPFYNAVEIGNSTFLTLLGVVGVVVGMGLIQMKPSSRVWGIVVAVCNILETLLHSGYTGIFVLPVLNQVFDQQAQVLPPELGDIMKVAMVSAMIFALIFNLAIWLAVFFLLNSRTSRDAFAGKTPPEPEVERPRSRYAGYDDEDADELPLPPPNSPPNTGITDRPSR